MHAHINHLIQTILSTQVTGLALTLAAMRAQIIAGVIDQPTIDDLAARCQQALATLNTQPQARLSLPLDSQAAVDIVLHTDGSANHYTLHFTPAPAYAERWSALYPQKLTIDRWRGDLN